MTESIGPWKTFDWGMVEVHSWVLFLGRVFIVMTINNKSEMPRLAYGPVNSKRKNIHVSLQFASTDLIIRKERNWNLVFDLEKLTFSFNSEHKSTYKRLVLCPCLIPSRNCEKSAGESSNSHHLITQKDNVQARTHDMCVDPRGYMTSGWRNLF